MGYSSNFNQMLKEASKVPTSPFANFCMALGRRKFYYNGRQIDKWEIFDLGFTNAEKILRNQTPIIYITP